MQRFTIYSFIFLSTVQIFGQSPNPAHMEMATTLLKTSLTAGETYQNLDELLKIGHRLSGSESSAKAIQWAKKKLESYDFDSVWLQPVMVPKWNRGTVASLTDGKSSFSIAALGNSIGTGGQTLTAEVIEVKSLKEVELLGEKVNGKIVFYNRPFSKEPLNTFAGYGGAVDQRSRGAAMAAQLGAVAVVVRSMTTLLSDRPHTGNMNYAPDGRKIPAVAISTVGAETLSNLLSKNPNMTLSLTLDSYSDEPILSYNVIADIRGREFPDEIIIVSGHFDSWDLSPGAHDDGGGCMQAVEVLGLFKQIGYQPKRTIRAILYDAEEFGGIGGEEYAKQAALSPEKHIAAIESDRGVFTPRGLTVQLPAEKVALYQSWKPYFAVMHSDLIIAGGSGVDIAPLAPLGTHLFGYLPDSHRYFDFHHSTNDDITGVNERELHTGSAVMALWAYLCSEEGNL